MPEGKMGWGREGDTARKNLYYEAIESEKNLIRFGESRFAQPEAREANPIELALLDTMPFDRGWDFTFAEKVVYGKHCQRGPQNIGNCVGYSHCLLLATRIAHELLVEGDPEETLGDYGEGGTPVPYIPYSYGAGRCLSGNMCGGGDGSYCSVQLRASMEHGFLPSDTEGLSGDVPQGSSSTGRKWGGNKSVLNEWRPKAIAFDLEHSWQIKSVDDAWKAIVEDKQPFQICSNWGFKARSQIGWDDYKFYEHVRSGSWAHSMQGLAGFENPKNGDRWFKIGNQWGEYHKDGWWFTVSADTLASWIRDADVRTIGEIKGRPSAIVNFDFPM